MLVLQNNINIFEYDELIKDIINFLLHHFKTSAEVVVRLVDEVEITKLNKTYRNKDNSTNVLSFPNTVPKEIDDSLGDIIICLDVIKSQAKDQDKTINNHLTHIIIHGFLHLFGYDHINNNDAKIMEDLEINLLNKLNINNPYI